MNASANRWLQKTTATGESQGQNMDSSCGVIQPLHSRAQTSFCSFDSPYLQCVFLRMCYRGMMTAATWELKNVLCLAKHFLCALASSMCFLFSPLHPTPKLSPTPKLAPIKALLSSIWNCCSWSDVGSTDQQGLHFFLPYTRLIPRQEKGLKYSRERKKIFH